VLKEEKRKWILNEYKKFYKDLEKDLEKFDDSISIIKRHNTTSNKLRKIALILLSIPEPTHISDIIAVSLLSYDLLKRRKTNDLISCIKEIRFALSRLNPY